MTHIVDIVNATSTRSNKICYSRNDNKTRKPSLDVATTTLATFLPPLRRILCFHRRLFLCLSATSRKNFRTDLHEIFREGWQLATEQRSTFGGDPAHRLDTGIVFRIRHYWEIRKVVNEHKSAVHTDSPDGGTGKGCLGAGMHCPNASSSSCNGELSPTILTSSI